MDKGDTAGFFVPGNRRTGMDRREFSYTFYVPERRCKCERRRFPTVIGSVGPEAVTEEGAGFVPFPGKHQELGRKTKRTVL